MNLKFCVKCNKKHTSSWGWKYKTWYTNQGKIEGWGCNPHPVKAHEWTTDSIKEQRKSHEKELLQPFRQGNLSKEYIKAYPNKANGMIKEGIVTKKQVKNAKNVWHGDNK